ncbi:MAG: packaged DNA stabilization protein [Pseudomonadota bacterium]
MQIPLLSGIKADNSAEFLTSYPLNLEPIVIDSNIAKGQLRATAGATPFATGPGIDRGGVEWNGDLYRVMGTSLVKVGSTGTVTVIGGVGGTGPVTFDMGFDRLAIRSGVALYYWNGAALSQVTDIDLGTVVDMLWIDGYYMTTDGTFIIVTELNDPTSIMPLKYGSAEEDPDMVTGLIKFRNEAYALGRYTIQVLRNVGGNGFPFANLRGASIPVGCVSPTAKCLYSDSFAFVGSARDEAIGVYLAGSGSATRISTRAIDDELAKVVDPTQIVLENRTSRAERRLFVHLPDKSLVFLLNASKMVSDGVWYVAQSGIGKAYRPRNAVMAYGKTFVGDVESAAVGELRDDVSTHFGEAAQWQFDCGLLYNAGKGGLIKSLELVGLPGRGPFGTEGTAFLSMTRDGQTYSVERGVSMGKVGDRGQRMQWRPRVNFRNWLGFRFRGLSAAMPGFAACEADVAPLA